MFIDFSDASSSGIANVSSAAKARANLRNAVNNSTQDDVREDLLGLEVREFPWDSLEAVEFFKLLAATKTCQ